MADRADITIATSGVRHTTSLVNDRLNRSIQRWLLMVAEAGDDTNLKSARVTTSSSSTRDAANWAPQQYVTQPTGLLLLRGLDVWLNGAPLAMLGIDELERDDAAMVSAWWGSPRQGLPVFYRLGGINAAGSSLIQIFPWADAAYTVDIRYIPAHVDVVNDADTIDFIAGGEEWVINDTVMQSKITDGLSGTADLSVIVGMNAKIEAELRFALACRSVTRRVDTREYRRRLRDFARGALGFAP